MNETVEAQFRREFGLPRYRVTRTVQVLKTFIEEGHSVAECKATLDDRTLEESKDFDALGDPVDHVEDLWK